MDESSQSVLPETIHMIGVSVRGPLHHQNGLPCQDACAFELMNSGQAIIAVADGLGSALRADTGARVAVDAAMDFMRQTCLDKSHNPEESLRNAVVAARAALELKAVELQCPLNDLATTLILAWIGRDSVAAAHLGDGAVVCQTDAGLIVLSGPGESEYANEVVPLSSHDWERSLHVAGVTAGVYAVAAFTDGCQRAGLKGSSAGRTAHPGFFLPLIEYVSQRPGLERGCAEFRELLESQKFQDHSEDDKSLVIAILPGRVTNVRPDGV